MIGAKSFALYNHHHHYDDTEDGNVWEHIQVLTKFLSCLLLLMTITTTSSSSSTSTTMATNKNNKYYYPLLILPFGIIQSIPFVLQPLLGHNTATIMGPTLILYGLTLLLRKQPKQPKLIPTLAAISFLLGIVWTCVITIDTTTNTDDYQTSDMFSKNDTETTANTTISNNNNNNTAGWGLLVACASLLGALIYFSNAIKQRTSQRSSSHHLHNRNHSKNTEYMVYLFGIIFGCGIAWYITITYLDDYDIMSVQVMMLLVINMCISSVGTMVGILSWISTVPQEINDVKNVFLITSVLFQLTQQHTSITTTIAIYGIIILLSQQQTSNNISIQMIILTYLQFLLLIFLPNSNDDDDDDDDTSSILTKPITPQSSVPVSMKVKIYMWNRVFCKFFILLTFVLVLPIIIF